MASDIILQLTSTRWKLSANTHVLENTNLNSLKNRHLSKMDTSPKWIILADYSKNCKLPVKLDTVCSFLYLLCSIYIWIGWQTRRIWWRRWSKDSQRAWEKPSTAEGERCITAWQWNGWGRDAQIWSQECYDVDRPCVNLYVGCRGNHSISHVLHSQRRNIPVSWQRLLVHLANYTGSLVINCKVKKLYL